MRSSPPPSLVRIASIAWMVGFSMVLAFVGFIVVGAITNMQGRAVPIIGFSILTVMVPAGLIFLTVVVLGRCPHCGRQFFRNSDGIGTRTFRYHPTCPRLFGVNPLVYQTVRCAATGQMRCVHCGEELFPPVPSSA